MEYFYKINSTIESYYAIETEELSIEGYSAKFTSINRGDFKWNKMEAFFYTNGQMKDFCMNGWVFSHRIEGRHRIYNVMNPGAPEFIINGIDPLRQHFQAKIYTWGFLKEAVADYMNSISLYSKFPNRDIAQSYNSLLNWNEEPNNEKRGEILPLVNKLREYYKNTDKNNSDALLLDQVKLIVNKSIDDYLNYISELKI